MGVSGFKLCNLPHIPAPLLWKYWCVKVVIIYTIICYVSVTVRVEDINYGSLAEVTFNTLQNTD